MPAMTAGVLSSSSVQTAGLASGILNFVSASWGALGVALFGALVGTAQTRGMFWAFALPAVIVSNNPHHLQKIHSINTFNLKD
jgi:MFS transporter, DHA2 family, methylenomycin A resistance protein